MTNPFRPARPAFLCGEPQDEALARLDYLRTHGLGWCVVQGPSGIGKSMLLAELARRARQRGDDCTSIEIGPHPPGDGLRLLAEAWNLASAAMASPIALRRALQEQLVGRAALNRVHWVLVDHAETITPELTRSIRWLISAATTGRLSLNIVVADGTANPYPEADLRLELWPWELADCRQYISQRLENAAERRRFDDEALAAVYERTGGVPGSIRKVCEWVWLAAQAEAVAAIDADLVHAVADELLPSDRRPPSYEMSAAYGGW
jgi:type II secretory pathway predicted ATPase ExeA